MQNSTFLRICSNIETETGMLVLSRRQEEAQWIIILESPEATWSFEEKVYEDEDKSIFVLFCFSLFLFA